MILGSFMLLILLFSVFSFFRWRTGLYLVVLAAALQDPARKIVPGAPAWMALSTVPLWVGILAGAFRSGDLRWSRLSATVPGLARAVLVVILLFTPAAFMSLTYGPGSWQITLLGVFSHSVLLLAMMAAIQFSLRDGELERLLFWFVLVNAVALVGVPLERLGIGVTSGLTGTATLDAFWVTYRTGEAVRMYSGFFRSPDIMGWYAATLGMFALILSFRVTGWKRILLLLLAGWGGVGIMLCGRRKMIGMFAVFIALLLVLLLRYGRVRRVGIFGGIVAAGLVGAGGLYQIAGPDQAIEVFYATTSGDAIERVQKHGLQTVVGTISQAGFFGYGLGMTAQGSQHIQADRPRIWQESALDRTAAEVGVPGLAGVLLLFGAFALASHRLLRRLAPHPSSDSFFGLAALLLANVASSIVSSQVYGDPFIGAWLATCAGFLLSGTRVVPFAPPRAAAPVPPPPRSTTAP